MEKFTSENLEQITNLLRCVQQIVIGCKRELDRIIVDHHTGDGRTGITLEQIADYILPLLQYRHIIRQAADDISVNSIWTVIDDIEKKMEEYLSVKARTYKPSQVKSEEAYE